MQKSKTLVALENEIKVAKKFFKDNAEMINLYEEQGVLIITSSEVDDELADRVAEVMATIETLKRNIRLLFEVYNEEMDVFDEMANREYTEYLEDLFDEINDLNRKPNYFVKALCK